MKINPEFKSLIPPLTSEELAGLEASIKAEGCRDPLVVWNDVIVDGHNRFEICQKHGKKFQTVKRNFKDTNEAKCWIIRNQFDRRNLHPLDRSLLALKLEEIIKPVAKAQQGTRTDIPQKSAECLKPIETRREIAKVAKVSHDTIAKVKVLKDKATPEQMNKIRRNESTINREYVQIRRDETKAIKQQAPALPSSKYRIIYADPPWSYGNAGIIGDTDNYGHVARHYPAMSIAQLCDMKIKGLAETDAVLFMWVTSPLLAECWQVITAWGFKYKTSFVWDKVKHNFGHYNSVRHELLLICTRGSCTPDSKELLDSVVTIERSAKHSEKPEEFRKIIEKLYTHGKRLELFARTKTAGWDTYGNEL